MENKEISDDLFVDYLNNNLSVEQMKEIERQLLIDGEADAIYHAIVGSYELMKSYADELIGVDEEDNVSLLKIRKEDFPIAAKKINKLNEKQDDETL